MGIDWDKRRAQRKEVFGHAIIVAPGLRADCVIRDLSATGAKLGVSWRVKLPKEFDVVLVKTNSTRHVSLRWRRGDFAGVQFDVSYEAGSTPEPPKRTQEAASIKSSWRGFRGKEAV
jgi:hypothetical protein